MISINGIKASGKTLLAAALETAGHGKLVSFFSGRWKFEQKFLPLASKLEKGEFRKNSTVAMFGIEWHRSLKHSQVPLIFDHYYPDHWVFGLEGFNWFELKRFVKFYELPWLDEGKHFFLDIDYETYRARKELRNIPGEGFFKEPEFEDWRNLYHFLVDEEVLIKIDATQDPLSVFQEVYSHL